MNALAAAKEFIEGPRVPEAVRALLDHFPVAALCAALAAAQGEDAELLINALERLAEFDEVRDLFLDDSALHDFLRQGASSPDPRARGLVANLLVRLSSHDGSAARLVVLIELLEALFLVPETNTSEAAGVALIKIAAASCSSSSASPESRMAILGSDGGVEDCLVRRFQGRVKSMDDTCRFRVLHLFVELGQASNELFSGLEARGAFKDVLGAFLTDDILLKLNAVELMDKLGSYQAGQELFTRQGLPAQLARELTDPCCDTSVSLCVTRLLSSVLFRAPEFLADLLPNIGAPLAKSIATFLGSRDPSEKLCAVNAFGQIAAHPEGLGFFLRWSEVLGQLITSVASPQNEVSKGAMSAWVHVLSRHPPPTSPVVVNPQALNTDVPMDQALWAVAESKILPLTLQAISGKPFPDVRRHTWQLLTVLIRPKRACQSLLTANEIRNTLLDFSSEQGSEPRIAKHEFVQALVQLHGSLLTAFLEDHVEQLLLEYARQSPYWMPRGSSVAVGDAGC